MRASLSGGASAPATFVVGAGPVAIALAGALRRGGAPVLGLWARRVEAAQRAGAIAGVLACSPRWPGFLRAAEAVILAVRDEAIAEVAERIVGTGLIAPQAVLLHCSGAHSAAAVLGAVHSGASGQGGLTRRVAEVATMHPLRALADGARGIAALPGTVFGVEGSAGGVSVARRLVECIGGVPVVLAGASMAAYHTAASMASNFAVALLDAAVSVLGDAGVSADDGLRALLSLMRGSLGNVAVEGAVRGLTGPIRRAEVTTVERHLEALRERPDVLAMYRVLGLRTVALARRRAGVPRAGLDAIAQLLADGSGCARPITS